MTYVVGWKAAGVTYLCGDTALTHFGVVPSCPSHSSYGEAHLQDGRRFVAEGMLKLYNLKNVALALTGEITGALEFIEELAHRLNAGESPVDAVQRTVAARTPLEPPTRYSLLIAVSVDRTSKLFVFNPTGDQSLIELKEGEGAQLGSLGETKKAFLPRWIRWVNASFYEAPHILLAIAVSVLQSYGIHDYLIGEGVGGPFVGLAVDANGVHWQGDIMTIIYGPEPQKHNRVATIIRDNVLIVWSGVTETTRFFGDVLTGFDLNAWNERWSGEMADLNRGVKYDFVTLLSNRQRTVTVVEMRRELRSECFYFDPPSPKLPGQTEFEFRFGFNSILEDMMRTEPTDKKDGWPPLAISWAPFKNSNRKGDPPPESDPVLS